MQISRMKPWRILFFSFTRARARSQPRMASDLSCVTLLPRPDRTGKLIAKVKRNKGAMRARARVLTIEREDGRERKRYIDRLNLKERKRQRGKAERKRKKCKILSIRISRPGNHFPRSNPRREIRS
ncbi:hypothetical protein ACS0PU_011956 [Formica fusca]